MTAVDRAWHGRVVGLFRSGLVAGGFWYSTILETKKQPVGQVCCRACAAGVHYPAGIDHRAGLRIDAAPLCRLPAGSVRLGTHIAAVGALVVAVMPFMLLAYRSSYGKSASNTVPDHSAC